MAPTRSTKSPWVDPLSAWLIRRVERRAMDKGERRTAYGSLEGWVGLFLNGILFAIKLALGLVVGSVALVADAVHTLADSITSAVLIVGSRIASRPPDEEHPYGHGRAELVAAMIIAVLLGVAGIEFMKSSIARVVEPSEISASWLVVGVVVLLAIIKEWNARFAVILAAKSGSKAIEADAWHHRSDVFATLLVAVGIVGSEYGMPVLDGVMGILVSLVILFTALELARDSIDEIMGSAPSPEEIREVADAAMSVEGVRGVHDIVLHNYGARRLVSLHVETSAEQSALSLHTLAEEVQDRVSGGRKGHVVVHIDPVDRSHPRYAEVRAAVKKVLDADERIDSFHDMRLVGEGERTNLVLDVVVCPDAGDTVVLCEELSERLREAAGVAAVVVEAEPLFAYDGRAGKRG